GRSGRQGDPGSSRFYLSLEDNLMRIFAADWVQKVMARMGLKEDDIIESPLVSRQIANAQRKVEAHNFDIRKNLLEFDDVNNDQRKVIYGQRNELLEAESIKDNIDGIRADVVAEVVERFVPPDSIDEQWDLPGLEATLEQDFGQRNQLPRAAIIKDNTDGCRADGVAEVVERCVPPGSIGEQWDLPGLEATLEQDCGMRLDLQGLAKASRELDADGIQDHVREALDRVFEEKEAQVGAETMRALEKHIMLSVLDENWKQHLARMDYLRQGIHLRGYAQKQPKQEYKREAFELFSEMLDKVKREVIMLLAR